MYSSIQPLRQNAAATIMAISSVFFIVFSPNIFRPFGTCVK